MTPSLRRLFDRLNENHVRYVVLRGFVPLARLDEQPDIDIYIDLSAYSTFEETVVELGWQRLIVQYGGARQSFFEYLDEGLLRVIKLHVVHDLIFGGTDKWRFAAQDIITTDPTYYSNVPTPQSWVAALIFALRLIFERESISEKDRNFFLTVYEDFNSYPPNRSAIENRFKDGTLSLLDDCRKYIAALDHSKLTELKKFFIDSGCVLPVSLYLTGDIVQYWRRMFSWFSMRVVMRRQFRVAVVGPDGAGKTSIVNCVKRRLKGLAVNDVYLGHKDHVWRFVGNLQKMLTPKNVQCQGKFGVGKIIRVAAAIVYQLLWPVEVRLRLYKASRGTRILLADRYPILDDVQLPLVGKATTCFRWLITMYTSFIVPTPHIVVVCDGDPEIVYGRKKEHDYDVFVRQRTHYLNLTDSNKFEAFVLRTDRCIDNSCDELISHLFNSTNLRETIYG